MKFSCARGPAAITNKFKKRRRLIEFNWMLAHFAAFNKSIKFNYEIKERRAIHSANTSIPQLHLTLLHWMSCWLAAERGSLGPHSQTQLFFIDWFIPLIPLIPLLNQFKEEIGLFILSLLCCWLALSLKEEKVMGLGPGKQSATSINCFLFN